MAERQLPSLRRRVRSSRLPHVTCRFRHHGRRISTIIAVQFRVLVAGDETVKLHAMLSDAPAHDGEIGQVTCGKAG